MGKMNLALGIVDKLGDRATFDKRVAELVGSERQAAGSFKAITLKNWIAANPAPTERRRDRRDHRRGRDRRRQRRSPAPRAARRSRRCCATGWPSKKLKALVVRVDSPGGSALASEEIRQAILEAKAQGLPVVVSMGGLAASGGYWVSTAGDTIFAEPNTITGSIGIFGILPSFENALAKIGVTADGVATTPLSRPARRATRASRRSSTR